MRGPSAFAADALAGRTALVTGGGSGIGLAIATPGRAGANVVLASRKLDRLEAAAEGLRAAGGRSAGRRGRCASNRKRSQAAVAAAVQNFGGLDIMIANAAGNFVVPFAEMSFNAWRTVIDIDLHGTFNCAKAAYPHLKTSPHGGRLIAISTMRALEGWPGCAHAAAAKAGVMSLIRTLAVEWGPDGILCNTIAPGPDCGHRGRPAALPGHRHGRGRSLPACRWADRGRASMWRRRRSICAGKRQAL